MDMHYVTNIDKGCYHKILEYLMRECDTFSLVEPIMDSYDFPEVVPPTKQSLIEFQTKKSRVDS